MFDINECESEMKATISAFASDLKKIRTGRVSPDMLKNIIIDSYAQKCLLPNYQILIILITSHYQ